MCGRYALALRPSEVRAQLETQHMPVHSYPPDDTDQVKRTYNFAPGNHGLVYRASSSSSPPLEIEKEARDAIKSEAQDTADIKDTSNPQQPQGESPTHYTLQPMKWGLVPSYTQRSPDYAATLKTINCRDDSLREDRGMWNSVKRRKRCVVVAQGFYEWRKAPGSKVKVPFYTKRKDGKVFCFAGLWDCVKYKDSDHELYTYSIITTESNAQLRFLHDRMPVILENGSEDVSMWLDPGRDEWSEELQALLKPFEGELECYAVSGDVGKVGNDSPSFVVPVGSAENRGNIENFFGAQRGKKDQRREGSGTEAKREHNDDNGDVRETTTLVESTEDNAPLPVPELKSESGRIQGSEAEGRTAATRGTQGQKRAMSGPGGAQSPVKKMPKLAAKGASKATRSATSNGSATKKTRSGQGDGSRKITSFFGQK